MLDLSKLDAVRLPSREIEVSVGGGPKQHLTVTCYDDGTALDIGDIDRSFPGESERRIRVMLLQKCAGLSAADAEKLVSLDAKASGEILSAVFDLRDEFSAARKAVTDEAKKNSPARPDSAGTSV